MERYSSSAINFFAVKSEYDRASAAKSVVQNHELISYRCGLEANHAHRHPQHLQLSYAKMDMNKTFYTMTDTPPTTKRLDAAESSSVFGSASMTTRRWFQGATSSNHTLASLNQPKMKPSDELDLARLDAAKAKSSSIFHGTRRFQGASSLNHTLPLTLNQPKKEPFDELDLNRLDSSLNHTTLLPSLKQPKLEPCDEIIDLTRSDSSLSHTTLPLSLKQPKMEPYDEIIDLTRSDSSLNHTTLTLSLKQPKMEPCEEIIDLTLRP